VRYVLVYGTGPELAGAVAQVLSAAGLCAIALDDELGVDGTVGGYRLGHQPGVPSSRCRVFTVASSVLVQPSRAAAISPFSATGCWRMARTARSLPGCGWMRGLARKQPECDTLKL
jgi:hypothetical protein